MIFLELDENTMPESSHSELQVTNRFPYCEECGEVIDDKISADSSWEKKQQKICHQKTAAFLTFHFQKPNFNHQERLGPLSRKKYACDLYCLVF